MSDEKPSISPPSSPEQTLDEIRDWADRMTLDLKTVDETIGETTYHLSTLRDLDATIDLLFEELSKKNRPELLNALCPYFGVIWPSARALARVVDHGLVAGLQKTQDTRVLELGCGLALPALVAAKKGAQVHATDFHPQVDRFLKQNRAANQALNVRYTSWDWRALFEQSSKSDTPSGSYREKIPEPLAANWGQFDWAIASDVLYEEDLAIPLASAMAGAIKPKGRITITDPGRPYLQRFCDVLTKNEGFQMATEVLRVSHPKKEDPRHEVEIFVLHFSKQGQFPISSAR
jgi:predicted nicotinamide N-methyase